MTDHRTLRDFVTAGTWSQIESKGSSFLAKISKFQPWLAAVWLEQENAKAIGLLGEFSLEKTALQVALSTGARVDSLESAKQQLESIANLPNSAAETLLAAQLNEDEASEKIGALHSAWLGGDGSRLRKLLVQGGADGQIESALLQERNRKWIKAIESYLRAEKPTVVLVGIQHLLGAEPTLLRNLEGAGWKVRKVN